MSTSTLEREAPAPVVGTRAETQAETQTPAATPAAQAPTATPAAQAPTATPAVSAGEPTATPAAQAPTATLAADDVVLQIQHVDRIYEPDDGREGVVALHDVSLDVRRGEFVSLIGHSGCGKTTLLRLIAGLDEPQGGRLLLNGRPITQAGPDRGYVFQQGSLFPWLTVRQNIGWGLRARGARRGAREKVRRYIDLIGLQGFEDVFPHQISGGMAQRVAIARSLINDPEVLLLDEPMGALDSFTRADLQDKLLSLWAERHATMILVTHDVDEAIYLSDRIVIMTPRPGRVSEVIEVGLPRPRNRASREFLTLRAQILEKLHLAGE